MAENTVERFTVVLKQSGLTTSYPKFKIHTLRIRVKAPFLSLKNKMKTTNHKTNLPPSPGNISERRIREASSPRNTDPHKEQPRELLFSSRNLAHTLPFSYWEHYSNRQSPPKTPPQHQDMLHIEYNLQGEQDWASPVIRDFLYSGKKPQLCDHLPHDPLNASTHPKPVPELRKSMAWQLNMATYSHIKYISHIPPEWCWSSNQYEACNLWGTQE